MHEAKSLEAFWFSSPLDPHLPFGMGVTAYSETDARTMLEEQGVGAWFSEAKVVSVKQGVRIHDLDQRNVVPNIGPMQLRGVWYPCMNIGYGAPKSMEYKVLAPSRKAEQ